MSIFDREGTVKSEDSKVKGLDFAQLGINVVNKEVRTMLDEPLKPITNLYGSGNIKDVIALLCGLVNTAARKAGVTSYLGLLPDVFAAVSGFNLVLEEVVDLTEAELTELKQFATNKLDLPDAQDELEKLAEGIVYHSLGILMIVVKYFRAVKAVQPLT